MEDTQLFQEILGLKSPWIVSKINRNFEEKELILTVSYPQIKVANCPQCEGECQIYDYPNTRRWRHLDTMQFKTFIEAQVPRIKCKEHGVVTIKVPWSEAKSRFTELFEKLAIDTLLACKNNTSACELLRLSWDEAELIKKKAVKRGLEKRNTENIEYLGIDEKSFLKGHDYATVLVDIEGRRVLDVERGRTEEAAKSVINKSIKEEQKKSIKAVCADMWQGFINAIAKELPDSTVVHDVFHISKYLNEAVNKVRVQEDKELSKEKNNSLKKSKWVWLKREEKLTEKERTLFGTLLKGNFRVGKAYVIKEQFKGIYSSQTIEQGKKYFSDWYELVIGSGIKPMIRVANMLRNRLEGVLNYIKNSITNGSSEGINSLIQGLKAIARGYRNFDNFRISILFHLGKLSLYP
jgi:transposase